MTEYLLTGKPCIHLISKDGAEYNDMVKKISKSYYQTYNITELQQYLDEIILNQLDTKKQARQDVLQELGLEHTNCAQNIIANILQDCS